MAVPVRVRKNAIRRHRNQRLTACVSSYCSRSMQSIWLLSRTICRLRAGMSS